MGWGTDMMGTSGDGQRQEGLLSLTAQRSVCEA